MRVNDRRTLVCDCEGTMALDGRALARACGADGPADVNRQLCRAQLDNFRAALRAGEPLLVACTQEQPLFEETLVEEESEADVRFVNIRERAGWSAAGKEALPKIAALLAEATVEVPPTPSITIKSEGTCLVYGRDEQAIEAARQLADRLDVTVLLTKPGEVVPPRVMDIPVFQGTVVAAKGHLGGFEIVVDDYAAAAPSSRDRLVFAPGRKGASATCDVIVDLTGGAPLFVGHDKRDGYFRPDPGDPAAVQKALFQAADLTGEFEKPRYVDYDGDLCAHARSRKTGCTRCLDVCPAGAIRPDGDVVAIDPHICGGCGACASVCPTGAAAYAMPPTAALFERLRVLLATYHEAGGRDPVLLVHDTRHGEELIGLVARFGRGLPAGVLPFAVNQATQVGFDLFATALAYGAARVLVLVPPERRGELVGLAGQIGIAEAVMDGLGYGGGRVATVEEIDPEAVEARLWDLPRVPTAEPGRFLPVGTKRSVTRVALEHLHAKAPRPVEALPLPPGAPFGATVVDVEGCTLCLACVGACPTGALIDNPDKPQLRFQELACVQCGLCQATCPEKVIRLEPRINFAASARQEVVVKEEEPFACIRCGKPFGTKSSVERIVGRLAGKHAMFRDPKAIERIQMCDNCRVVAQFEVANEPFAGAPRPLPRTTEDDLREREIEEARARLQAEREGREG